MENTISEATAKLARELAKKKDIWFLETMEKHDLIKSQDISNFDLFWLQEEMGVRLVSDSKKTQIYINEKLVGEWFDNYEIEVNDNTFNFKTKCWN